MLTRTKLPLACVLAVLFQVVAAPSAWAHHPILTASAVCQAGSPVINFTATSDSPLPLIGENADVDILFNGVVVANGAFVYPTNSFSGSAPAPGEAVTVMLFIAGPWGDGAPAGESVSTVVTVPTDCVGAGTGRFTGGGHQLRVGEVRVTRGLTIHCDLLLSNNLEVNWGGDKFHMTEHLQTVACTDSPDITQAPPAAPLDTLIGVGTGRYNNADGYTINFTLVDYGEPGSSDQMSILIYETANPANVVLNVPLQLLSGGNLQAHYDQPHK
jgi:hypothetical protein